MFRNYNIEFFFFMQAYSLFRESSRRKRLKDRVNKNRQKLLDSQEEAIDPNNKTTQQGCVVQLPPYKNRPQKAWNKSMNMNPVNNLISRSTRHPIHQAMHLIFFFS